MNSLKRMGKNKKNIKQRNKNGMAQAKLRDMELEIEVIGNIYENQKK